jgi:hypothetical protein
MHRTNQKKEKAMRETHTTDFAASLFVEDEGIILSMLEELVLSHKKRVKNKHQNKEFFLQQPGQAWLRGRAMRRSAISEILKDSDKLSEWVAHEAIWEKYILFRKEKKASYKSSESELRAFLAGLAISKSAEQPFQMIVWQSITMGWQGLFPVRNLAYQRLFFETYGSERGPEEVVFDPIQAVEGYEPIGKLIYDFELQGPMLRPNLPPKARGAFATGQYSHHLLEMGLVYRTTCLPGRLVFSREEWMDYLARKGQFSSLPGDADNYAGLPLKMACKHRLIEHARPDVPKVTLLNFSLTLYK